MYVNRISHPNITPRNASDKHHWSYNIGKEFMPTKTWAVNQLNVFNIILLLLQRLPNVWPAMTFTFYFVVDFKLRKSCHRPIRIRCKYLLTMLLNSPENIIMRSAHRETIYTIYYDEWISSSVTSLAL